MEDSDIALPVRVSIEMEDGEEVMTVRQQKQFSISTVPCETNRVVARYHAILIDWIMDVCYVTNNTIDHPSTFFLFVELYRRFYSVNPFQKNTLQLFSIACLMIANKFNDELNVSIEHFIYLSANAYTRKQFVDAEMRVLDTLDWKIRSAENTSYYGAFDRLLSIKESRFSEAQIKYMVYSYIGGVTDRDFFQFRLGIGAFERTMNFIVSSKSCNAGQCFGNPVAKFVYDCVMNDYKKQGAVRMSKSTPDDVIACRELLKELVIL